MPPAGFKTTIPVSEQPQTHALDRAATAIGSDIVLDLLKVIITAVVCLAPVVDC
jgi:hypothetical protein